MVLENYQGRLGFGLIADSHMLGYACFRLPIRSRVSALSSSLTHSPCSYSHSYSYKSIQRHSAASSSLVLFPRSVFQRDRAHSSIEGCCHLSNLRRTQHHSSTCLLAAGNANGCVGASIWHALLPSCHFSDTQKRMPVKVCNGTGIGSCFPEVRSSVGIYGKCDSVNCARFSSVGGGGFSEGSWNATWDVRPARWLHGSHSAWLLFGVCACFANLNPTKAEAEGPAVVDEGNDGGLDEEEDDAILAETDKASHGKKIYTDYSITGIPGDGRCLFRAVAHGACLRKGKPSPNESLQRELADELRARVADELIKRRDESEWFIEGDFDTYVEQIRKPHVWGGEPELIMASHVLLMPITVYIHDRNSDGLIAIAEYGQDYGKGNPVRVLFRGYGHYDALQIHND